MAACWTTDKQVQVNFHLELDQPRLYPLLVEILGTNICKCCDGVPCNMYGLKPCFELEDADVRKCSSTINLQDSRSAIHQHIVCIVLKCLEEWTRVHAALAQSRRLLGSCITSAAPQLCYELLKTLKRSCSFIPHLIRSLR